MVALATNRPSMVTSSRKDGIPNASNVDNVINRISRLARAFFIISGIYLCYIISSYYHEKISLSFGRVKNKDSISIVLIMLLYLTNTVSAVIYLLIQHLFNKLKDLLSSNATNDKAINDKNGKYNSSNPFICLNKRAIRELLLISFSLTASAIASTFALKHITFPTQVLVKSGKMIPIVLGSYIIFGKKYDSFEYIMVIIITISLVFFNIFKTITHQNKKNKTFLGIALCFLSLIFDSYTGPSQEQLMAWCNINPITMMLMVNLFSFIYSFIISLYFGLEAFDLFAKNPILKNNVFLHTITASFGQFFMYFSINEFGSLYTCIITTTRKALTTLISIYFFGHKISVIQWVCIFAIFSTLLAQQYYKAHIKVKKL